MNTRSTQDRLTLRNATESDRGQIRRLLESVKLPTESLDTGATTFYVAEENGTFVGVAGFEFYGNDALLRSVAVAPALQGRRLGDQVVDFMIATARRRKMSRIVLLTETAEKFFRRKGFTVVDRSSITNDSMKQSSEFAFACRTSAICMLLDLNEKALTTDHADEAPIGTDGGLA